MFRSIKCIRNSITKNCNKRYVKEISDKISINNSRIQTINRLQRKLRGYIENENLEAILELDMKEIEEYNINYDDIKYKVKSICELNPDVCKSNIKINIYKLEKLDREIKEKIDLYNKDLLVLEKLKKHCLKEKEIHKEVYLKFGRDRNNNLIALYFDIEKFVKSNLSTVYLFTQNQDYFNPSVLFLKYENYLGYGPKRYINEKDNGYTLICDFRVVEKRIGHGTFMLSNIVPILKEVNKKIRYINRNLNYDDLIINEIVAVNGMVCPGSDISYEDLVKFYNKNGYPTYDNRYIKDRNIYKEI